MWNFVKPCCLEVICPQRLFWQVEKIFRDPSSWLEQWRWEWPHHQCDQSRYHSNALPCNLSQSAHYCWSLDWSWTPLPCTWFKTFKRSSRMCGCSQKNTLHCSIINETSPYVLFQKWEKWPGDMVHPVCALGHCCIVKGALLQHNLSQTQIHVGIPVIKHTSNDALEMEKTRQTFVHKIFTY